MARTTKPSTKKAATPATKSAKKPASKSTSKPAPNPAAKAAVKPSAKTVKPAANKPAVNKSAAKKPTVKKAAAKKPVVNKPEAKKPAKADAPEDKAATTAAVAEIKRVKDEVPKTDTIPPKEGKTEAGNPNTKPSSVNPDAGPKPAGADLVPLHEAPAHKPGKKSVLPMVLGGAIAAAIGFGAALLLPSDTSTNPPGFEQWANQQEATIKALEGELEAQANAPDLSGIEATQAQNAAGITDISDRLNAIDTRMADLETRLTALANRPAPAGGGVTENSGDIGALQAALAEQKLALEALASEAAAQEKAANAEAQAVLQRAAISRVQAALDNGSAYAPALDDLVATGITVPDALTAHADSGVASLAQLQEDFPDAARAALSAARIASPETGEAGFMAFMRDQLGARSLEPQEGNSPDAILSRAEAANREGRLNDALSELEALPDVAGAELANWVKNATERQNALAALQSLSGEQN